MSEKVTHINQIYLYLFPQIHKEGNLQYDLNDLDDAVDHKHDTEGGIAVLGEEGRDDGEQEVDKGKKPCGKVIKIIHLCDLHIYTEYS